jgi:maleate isomerase
MGLSPSDRRPITNYTASAALWQDQRGEGIEAGRQSRGRTAVDEARRLGIIMPCINTAVEAWYPVVAPAGVSFHFARMLMPAGTSPRKFSQGSRQDGARATLELASCRLHAIAYGWTGTTIVQGHQYDAELRAELTRTLDIPATTVMESMFAAAGVFGIKRAIMISPYSEPLDLAMRRFLGEGGIDIVAGIRLDITDSFLNATPDGAAIAELALRAWDPSAEAVIAPGLNFRAHLAIETLEAALGRPVITATQAVLWRLLRLAGVDATIPGCGRLLRDA